MNCDRVVRVVFAELFGWLNTILKEPVKRVFLASLLCYAEEVESKFGADCIISQALIRSFNAAGITLEQYRVWCDMVRADWRTRNALHGDMAQLQGDPSLVNRVIITLNMYHKYRDLEYI